jgi:hypothetical protein
MLQTRQNWHQQGHERDTTNTLIREHEEYKEPSYRKRISDPFSSTYKDNQYSPLPAVNHPQTTITKGTRNLPK